MADWARHVLIIGLHDRPGAVHGVAEVFSGRGLQMEAFFGVADSLAAVGHAQALILFKAPEDRADLVARVLRRLSGVRSVELWSYDDPRLVMSVMVARADQVPPGVNAVGVGPDLSLVVGSPRVLQTWLESPGAPERKGAYRLDTVAP